VAGPIAAHLHLPLFSQKLEAPSGCHLRQVSGWIWTAQVTWGYHSVTAAMRLLLAAAVADPANTRFQFLDETSIPLYPPHLVWAQFVHETKTRMSACQVCFGEVTGLYSHVFAGMLCNNGSLVALRYHGIFKLPSPCMCAALSCNYSDSLRCFSTCSRKSRGSSGCRSLRGQS
jgi:hypothetical protein